MTYSGNNTTAKTRLSHLIFTKDISLTHSITGSLARFQVWKIPSNSRMSIRISFLCSLKSQLNCLNVGKRGSWKVIERLNWNRSSKNNSAVALFCWFAISVLFMLWFDFSHKWKTSQIVVVYKITQFKTRTTKRNFTCQTTFANQNSRAISHPCFTNN